MMEVGIMQATNSLAADGNRSCGGVSNQGNSISIRDTGIVILVNKRLGHSERSEVEQRLCAVSGVMAAKYCTCHPQLLVVTYESRQLASNEILDHLRRQGLSTRLIGVLPGFPWAKAD
jgi:hypothetical protein